MTPVSPPVAAYLEAAARLDAPAMLAPFAEGARVYDEGEWVTGREAIAAWIARATLANEARPEVLEVWHEEGEERVRARVVGSFRGSPVTLTHRFTVTDGRIASLRIG
ncbi:nuclear transport factor 2 family protein [Pseudoroseicyclus tamaricis]|uniref:Nuclear transport factor 2 family protein n=1 Tax=Pseudoroseicyclus tamaricis TaxID=2705421 RepID=A0A6B2JQX3_9RHOB|nr:nuclear transport factor 2 family protein [Pseudoroseicyclus tamaricis]NDV00375.1 nuclear transport factor 2 family protein [Pseudoroseicyclus tamaricis]